MAKINQEEYRTLKSLDDKWKWIARTRWSRVYIYDHKPWKESAGWVNYNRFYRLNDDLFQFIQWEDESPYNIAELIEEYECSAEHVSHVVNERVKALGKAWSESEETEVKKDIEWLRNEIKKLQVYTNNPMFGKFDQIRLWDVEELINQLDEPEVLSQEWIDDNKVARINNLRKMTTDDVVSVDKLQNLLVPKQELPVIPQFVADLLEEYKAKEPVITFYGFIKTVTSLGFKDNHSEGGKFTGWLTNKNEELLMRAWLDGYEVEEEQKYRVLDGNTTLLGRINGLMLTTVEILEYYPEYAPTFELTEQEIKDYDERYWAFAVRVEELEK